MNRCYYEIKTDYSTFEYDIIFGSIKSIRGESNPSLQIGDMVFVIVDKNQFQASVSHPYACILVSDDCIFKVDDKMRRQHAPLMLPIIKYGCLALHLLSIVRKPYSKIVVCSPFNIFHTISSFLKKRFVLEFVRENAAALPRDSSICCVHATPIEWKITYENETYTYNLEEHSLLDIFEHSNIHHVLTIALKLRLLANVIYVGIDEVCGINFHKTRHSRFYKVLTFSNI